MDVPPKNVVTFKPGKEMEERVRQMTNVPALTEEEEELVADYRAQHGRDPVVEHLDVDPGLTTERLRAERITGDRLARG